MTAATPKSDAIKGGLYDLLVEKIPLCVADNGTLSVADLADRLNMSPEGVYRWLRSDEISKRGRARLVELGNDDVNTDCLIGGVRPITEDDLRPFL